MRRWTLGFGLAAARSVPEVRLRGAQGSSGAGFQGFVASISPQAMREGSIHDL